MDRSDLEKLSKQELVEMVLKLQRPSKTSRTSSKPPSLDRKARRETAKPGGAKPGHKGSFRSLHESPDEIVDHRPDSCPNCETVLDVGLLSEVVGEYDEIDLPPIRPHIRRHRRLRVSCPHCHASVMGALPKAATGSVFGSGIHTLVVYLKTFHAVSFSRLEGMLDEIFGVKVSQGCLVNMLRRSFKPFETCKQKIIKDLRKANVVASDETGIRIEGLNGYHWVFESKGAIVHEVQLSRAAQVVRDIMGKHKPQVWLSDGYSAQQGHGLHHQTCLAHLARDIAYGVEASECLVPFRLKLWMNRVFEFARNITAYAESTLKAKTRELENTLADILMTPSECDLATRIQAKLARAGPRLLTFVQFPGEVEVTNNGCERLLRPSVIQRKVTNGFRSMDFAKGDCAVRTVVDTQKLNNQSPYQTLTRILS